jgi:adenylate cyclase
MPPPPALSWRELRLASGLVLALFLLTHFLNHALGLVSVAAMEEARGWFNRIWRNPVGGFLLYGSLLLHFALALMALHRRRTLRMPLKEAAQLSLGLALPFLLVPHVTGTRLEWALTGRDVGYPTWCRSSGSRPRRSGPAGDRAPGRLDPRVPRALLLAPPRPWFRRWALPLYSAALLVPVLAILGFAQAGKAVAAGWCPCPRAPSRPRPRR